MILIINVISTDNIIWIYLSLQWYAESTIHQFMYYNMIQISHILYSGWIMDITMHHLSWFVFIVVIVHISHSPSN